MPAADAGSGSHCLWHVADGRCSSCKARRIRNDVLKLKDYGVCLPERDYCSCEFYLERPAATWKGWPMADELSRTYEEVLSPDRPIRMSALERLEVLSREKKVDGRAMTCLIPVLHAPEPEVRRKASWLVGKLAQNKEYTHWPLEALNGLLHDDDPEVRESAAFALEKFRGIGITE